VWILDADLAAAFDKIDHPRLLAQLGSFPARDMIRGWLKAGVFEAGKGFAPTVEGTPQGGLCSAEHKPPYEQCGIMRSAVLMSLVRAMTGIDRCA
jgi:RNA-directed DNA polymerase